MGRNNSNNNSNRRFKKNKSQKLKSPEKGELYAFVRHNNGNNFKVEFLDRSVATCSVLRSVTRNSWINENDLVLVSSKSSKGDNFEIIHHYSQEQKKVLKKQNKLEFIEKTNDPEERSANSNWTFQDDERTDNENTNKNNEEDLEDLISDI